MLRKLNLIPEEKLEAGFVALQVVKSGDTDFFFSSGTGNSHHYYAMLRPKIRCDILKCIQSGKI